MRLFCEPSSINILNSVMLQSFLILVADVHLHQSYCNIVAVIREVEDICAEHIMASEVKVGRQRQL